MFERSQYQPLGRVLKLDSERRLQHVPQSSDRPKASITQGMSKTKKVLEGPWFLSRVSNIQLKYPTALKKVPD